MIYFTTPREITDKIELFCKSISSKIDPFYIPVDAMEEKSNPHVTIDETKQRIEEYIAEHGGEIVPGWTIWEIPRMLLEAEFHAVYRSEKGEYTDLSSHVTKVKKILFLPDPSLEFTTQAVNSHRLPLVRHPLITEFIARANTLHALRMKYSVGGQAQIPVQVLQQHLPAHDIFNKQFQDLVISQRKRNDPCLCGSGKKYKNCCLK